MYFYSVSIDWPFVPLKLAFHLEQYRYSRLPFSGAEYVIPFLTPDQSMLGFIWQIDIYTFIQYIADALHLLLFEAYFLPHQP